MNIFEIEAGGSSKSVEGNLLDFLAINGLRPDTVFPKTNFPIRAGFLCAKNSPGAMLLQQKVSPVVVVNDRAFNGIYKMYPPHKYGYVGSGEDDCLYRPQNITWAKPLDQGSHEDYHITFDARAGGYYLNGADMMTHLKQATLTNCIAQLGMLAMWGANNTGSEKVIYSNRVDFDNPKAIQSVNKWTYHPYVENYGGQIEIGTSSMRLFHSEETGTTPPQFNRAVLSYLWRDLGGLLIAFPQCEPGAYVEAKIYATWKHKPQANYYIKSNRVTYLPSGGKMTVGLIALPIAGEFTNEWPAQIKIAEDALVYDELNGYSTVSPTARIQKTFDSVINRDNDVITRADPIGVPAAKLFLKVPPSRMMFLGTCLPWGLTESNGFYPAENVTNSLKIDSRHDSAFWTCEHLNAVKWYQQTDFEITLSVRFARTMGPEEISN